MRCQQCGTEIENETPGCAFCAGKAQKRANQYLNYAAEPPELNRNALIAFVLSLLGGGIISLVLGGLSLKQMKQSPRPQTGSGLAYTAIIISVMEVLLGCAFLYDYYAQPQVSADKAREARLQGNLQAIQTALEHFQMDTGAYPRTLEDLVAKTAPVAGVDINGNAATILTGSYKGPYLTRRGGIDNSGIPDNPYCQTRTTGNLSADLAAHWHYANGIINAVSSGTTNTDDNAQVQSL